MGPRAPVTRRAWLQAAAAWPLAACTRGEAPALTGGWVGASHARGHGLREALPTDLRGATPRRAAVLVVGGGIAGLAAARGFLRAGVDDVQLLELEDHPGGNSRGHLMAGMACPLGAHYLPQPQAPAHEVIEWLHEIGLLRQESGRTVADERQLCHAPQERLWIDGAWHEGLLPPAEPGSPTLAQYRRFAAAVAAAPAFAIPSHRAAWTAAHDALDGQTFGAWLDGQGLTDERLRWYLDYSCRDDYGAGLDTVSAWAGLHYFASRHGFSTPGDGDEPAEPVFTWPQGNAWLVQRLAAPLAGRLHGGRVVLRVREQRRGVQVLVRQGDGFETWTAGTVVLALPLFVATRVLDTPPEALRQAAAATVQAPWLVANLQIDKPPLDRPGLPSAWDSVPYSALGSRTLGYVDAMHQSLRPHAGATVLTAYATVPIAERQALLDQPWQHWARRMLDELTPAHPDLPERVQRIDLMRYGHAMAVPVPGRRHSAAARAALRGGSGRVRFAHADLAGYSVFEEAFIAGCEAASAPCRCA
ncbi:MAG: FAD-dependent oxidoreductase [Rubrivivax sp.]|nr:FAD-dependent oxidoreductase [Rubrivivax sp.]